MSESSIQLVARWRAGDQEAARELFDRYVHRLVELARGRLSKKLSQRVDPEDLVQSAYRSFFAGASADRFDIRRSGDLWQLLASITLNKLNDQVKYHLAAKRTVAGERSYGSEDSLFGLSGEALAREPSPLEAVALVDEVCELMRDLEPLQRQMLEMRLQGHGLTEIAEKTGRCPQTVRRLLARLQRHLERVRDTSSAP
jgi:RNA polymerase sigma-70 factor (ECF subfamily)